MKTLVLNLGFRIGHMTEVVFLFFKICPLMSSEKDQVVGRHIPEELLWDKENFPKESGSKLTVPKNASRLHPF